MILELCYTNKRGAGVVSPLHSAEMTERALKFLTRQHIEADLYIQGERDEQGNRTERVGGVDEIDGEWTWAFDPDVFVQGGAA